MSFLISEAAAPSTPSANKVAVYAKSDGRVYGKDDVGTEFSMSGGFVGTSQATTTGTTIDFTGLPSTVTKINFSFSGISTSGTSIPIIQIGDSGGIETSGYLGAGSIVASASATTVNGTTGFTLAGAWANTTIAHGIVTLTLLDSATNTWACSVVGGVSNIAQVIWGGGSKALSATLDRIRLTTVNGTDTFDAGLVNIQYM